MQYTLRVITKKTTSLRNAIINDQKRLDSYGLSIVEKKNNERQQGWTKIRMNGETGILNISWDGASSTLTARCISKKGNKPNVTMAQFVLYLMDKFSKKIHSIMLVP